MSYTDESKAYGRVSALGVPSFLGVAPLPPLVQYSQWYGKTRQRIVLDSRFSLSPRRAIPRAGQRAPKLERYTELRMQPPRLSMPGSPSFYGPVSPRFEQPIMYSHQPSLAASPVDHEQQYRLAGGAGLERSYNYSGYPQGPRPSYQPYYTPGPFNIPMQRFPSTSDRAPLMLRSPSGSVAPSLPSPIAFRPPHYSPSAQILGSGPPSPSVSLPPQLPSLRTHRGDGSAPDPILPTTAGSEHRAQSLSPRPPPKSPSLLSPPLTVSIAREEKKRKIVVRLPRERAEADEDADEEQARKRSKFVRQPMGQEESRGRIEQMDYDEESGDVPLEADELVSRNVHFDEIKTSGLPSTIDVYLPGKTAWEEVLEALTEERGRRLPRSTSPAERSRPVHQLGPASAPGLHRPHVHTGSLFSHPSHLPPRLQTAFLSAGRGFGRGHSAMASMGSPDVQPFIPSWAIQRSPTSIPLPESPVVGLKPGHFPPAPALGAATFAIANPPAAPQRPRLSFAELNRGFDITEEDEIGHFETDKIAIAKPSAPTRRNSAVSVGTGVASISDVPEDHSDEDEVLTNPSDDEPLQRRLMHLHQGSLGAEALVARREATGAQRVAYHSGDEEGYDGSEDGEGDLSEAEYSNPSEEDRAKRRAVLRAQSRSKMETFVLFEAPSDIDLSPVVDPGRRDSGSHRVTEHFAFPPKTPPRGLLPPTRGKDSESLDPTPNIARLDLALHDDGRLSPSPTPLAAAKTLNVAAPEFVFGRLVASPMPLVRQESSTSLNSVGLGPFGGPGSLTIDTPSTAVSPSPTIDPCAPEFVPSYQATNPDLPASGISSHYSTFDFEPPVNAPTLVLPAPSTPVARPLPPIPLARVEPHNALVKRQKVLTEAGSERAKASTSPEISHSLLHRAPQQQQQRSDEVAVDSNRLDAPEEGPSRGTSNGDEPDDPLPEHYAPSHTLGRAFTSNGRPFTLRPAASFSTDGRVVGFSTSTERRSPIPRFASEEALRTDPLKVHEQQKRQPSTDDIAVPNTSRPFSHAIAIPQQISTVDRNDVFGSEVLPLTPDSHGGSSTADEAGDDYPLRILEDLISTQFDALREDLSGLTSLKADLEGLKNGDSALLNAVCRRTEGFAARHYESKWDQTLAEVTQALSRGQQEQAETILKALESITSRLDTYHTKSFSEGLMTDLEKSIKTLQPQPVDADDLVFRLALAIQPQISNLVDRLGNATSSAVLDQLRPLLDARQPLNSVDSSLTTLESLLTRLEPILEQVVSSHASLSDVKSLAPRSIAAPPLASLSRSDGVGSLMKDEAELTSSLVEGMIELRGEIRNQAEKSSAELLEQFKALASTLERSADLNSQLAEARLTHDQAKLEASNLAACLGSEQAQHSAEVIELKRRLQAESIAKKDAREETLAHQKTIAHLQADLAASQVTNERLIAQVAEAREKEANARVEEARQSSNIAQQREKAEAAHCRAEALQAELTQVRSELAASEARRVECATQIGAYQERFASFEKDLLRMREEVGLELSDTSLKLAQLAKERDSAVSECAELRQELAFLLSSSVSTPPPTLGHSRHSSTSSSTGTVPHFAVSPSPSLGGLVQGEDGWWSSA